MSVFNSNKLREPVFVKSDSYSEVQLTQLKSLLENVDDSVKDNLQYDIKCLEKGLVGEKAIEFELKNSHIPMYVLHDVFLEHDGLTAQIDYIVITKSGVHIIECKNLYGNITVNADGSFVRSVNDKGRTYKEGIYSPLTQNNRHLELIKAIRVSQQTNFIQKKLVEKNFYDYFHSVVVLANSKTILNDKYAKKEVKQQIIRCDQLVEYIRKWNQEISEVNEFNDKLMKEYADMFMRISKNPTVDYTEKYKDKISNETYEKIAVENNAVTDNETIFCPVCGSPMVKRVAKRGNNIGNEFYGCTQFPKCRGIIQIK